MMVRGLLFAVVGIGCNLDSTLSAVDAPVDAAPRPFGFADYFKSSNSDPNDAFGAGLAISQDGTRMAVGAFGEDSNGSGPDNNDLAKSGAVYVFARQGDSWAQEAYLKASNAGADDVFGAVIAMSDDGATLVVGARREDSNGVAGELDDSLTDAGAAYVFVRTTDGWVQEAYLKASNPGALDEFGTSVAISGDGQFIAIGSQNEDSGNRTTPDEAAMDSGAVYIFHKSGTTWLQEAYVKTNVIHAFDSFGQAIALSDSGSVLVVGAAGNDSNATTVNGDETNTTRSDSGAAYVFTRAVSGVWTQQAFLKPTVSDESDQFGRRVAIDGGGTLIAVSAILEDSGGIGAPGDNSAMDSGAVYVFARTGGPTIWEQQAYLKASNPGAGDIFGFGISLSNDGTLLAITASKEDGSAPGLDGVANDDLIDSGAVYLFARSGQAWMQTHYVKAPTPDSFDELGGAASGDSTKLSGDGATLVVGSGLEDSNARGIGGDMTNNASTDAGAVFVYR